MATFAAAKRPAVNHEPTADGSKRQRLDETDENKSLDHDDYTVGWICALPIEMTAAEAMLDQIHKPLPSKTHDSNSYILGCISGHNVVITCLPAGYYGTNNAAIVANNMRRTFPWIDKSFMVGIGGGAPEIADVRLGDIVVSHQVVQYDFGKTLPNGEFDRTSLPTRPPQSLLTAVSRLQAQHNRRPSRVPVILTEIAQHKSYMFDYAHPGLLDHLFLDTYDHVQPNKDCDHCCVSKLVSRPPRQNNELKIHYGKIASGNQVIKDGATRKKLAADLDVMCFEMEAAGLMDNLPSLIVRGICDYSDSHKNKKWPPYAAAVAAAYTKELLSLIPGRRLDRAYQQPKSVSSTESLQARRSFVLESLKFAQIDARHDTIKVAHTKTCKWFLDHRDYTSWLDPQRYPEHHGFLWISGKPGAGKSTLMKHIYTQASVSSKNNQNAAVSSFFFNARGDELEKSTNGMYRSLILQLLDSFPDIIQILDQFAMACDQTEPISWETCTLQSLFAEGVSKIGERTLTCFIDALDECDQNEVEAMVEDFETLGNVASNNASNLYICFSSRHYPHIEIQDGLRVILEDQPGHSDDLEKYVRSKLRPGKKKPPESVITEVLEKAAGVFMWVVLVIDILNKEFKNGRMFAVKKRVSELPRKLSELFKDILSRDNENMDDLLLCIQWILYARRPLTCQEFYFALVSGLDPSRENLVGWDEGMITIEDMRLFLLSSSKGLAEETKSKKSATVQFIHESVRDFLLKDNGIRDLWPEFEIGFEARSHEQLKRCCANYATIDISELLKVPEQLDRTSSQSVKAFQSNISHVYPFMEYATTQLLSHANATGNPSSQDEFIRDFDLLEWIRRYNLFQKFKNRWYNSDPSLMYILADHGYTSLIRSANRCGKIIAMTKERYKHPLFAALINGHTAAAKVLKDIEGVRHPMYMTGNKGVQLLSWATTHGYTVVVNHLLNLGGFISDIDGKGQELLLTAMEKGHGEISNLLLEAFDDKITTWDIPILLSKAAMGGYTRVVERLLFLLKTAAGGHTRVVEQVLQNNDIHVDRGYDGVSRGRTLLSAAAERGHEGVVKLLLDTNSVEIDSKEELNRTPLSYAAERGHEGVVKLLLATNSIEINSRSIGDRTPLSYAAECGHEGVVKLLLATDSIEINSRSIGDRTPLSYAAEGGHEGVVKLLLATDSVEVNSKDNNGLVPLSYATRRGSDTVVKLLLATKSIEIDSKDSGGRTPLSYATQGRGAEAVKALLATNSVDINSRDNDGRTALSYAAQSGLWIESLLAMNSIEIDSIDNNGRTPLSYAIGSPWEVEVVGRLLERGNVRVNLRDKEGQTPLMRAKIYGQPATLDLLTGQGI